MTNFPPALRQRAMQLAQPLGAYLELTYTCNWRCVFCYNPRHFDVRSLPLEKWVEVLDDLRSLGTLTVTLTGGEPLAHPQFFEIAAEVRKRNFVLNIYTNGALIDDEAADRIAALSPSGVELSMHGATPDVHDATTRKPGSFARLWNAIRLLRERGVRITLKTPLTRENEHQLDAMIELARVNDVPYRLDHNITPRDDGDMTNQRHRASDAAVRRVIAMALRASETPRPRVENGTNCGLGRVSLAIDPEGNVFPCIQWRKTSVGNVREERLASMWQSSATRQDAARVAVEANTMLMQQDDEALQNYGFCPALAFQRAGNPLLIDETFRSDAHVAAELRAAAG